MNKYLAMAFVAACGCGMLATSCGGEKKEMAEFAGRFGKLASENALDSVKALYPTAEFDSVGLAGSLDSIAVGKTSDDGLTHISYGNGAWIEVARLGDGTLQVVKSGGVALFPQGRYAAGKGTGMFGSDASDAEVARLLADDAYFNWLDMRMAEKLDVALALTAGKKKFVPSMTSECVSVSMPVTITNNTKDVIEAGDYKVEYIGEFANGSDGSTPNSRVTRTKAGGKIAPGESTSISLFENCAVDIKSPKLKLSGALKEKLKGSLSYSGTEYAEYQKSLKN